MINRENYFDILDYLKYQEVVLQYSHKSIARKWGHLRHLLDWADDLLFIKASKSENHFPKFLLNSRNDRRIGRLSATSMQRACLEARSFFEWCRLHKASRYKRLPQVWIETIRPGRSIGMQSELYEREYYSLDEVRKLVDFQPHKLVDQRDKAATAFVFLSGIRVSAFVSLPVRCVDLENMVVDQLPSEGVQTKNSKAAKTYLLPIPDLIEIVADWDKKVRRELGEGASWYSPLSTDGMNWRQSEFAGDSESRRMSFSRGLRRLCASANISYRSPHKLRNGHGVYGVKTAKTIEEYKAFSQNMMHESMEITDRLYGKLARNDVKTIINRLSSMPKKNVEDLELLEQFRDFLDWREDKREK